jgi:hypothetical protein
MAVISKPLVLDVQGPILLTLSVLLMCGMLCRPEEPEGHPQGGLYAMCRAWSLYGKMFFLVVSSFCWGSNLER